MSDQSVTIAENPFVPTEPTFVAIPMHLLVGTMIRENTLEKARLNAAQHLVHTGQYSVGVFRLVGVVTKPTPNLEWHASKTPTND